MIIGIDIRNIGKKRTGDEVVFFNLTKSLALIDDKNDYKLFTDITDTEILQNIVESLELKDKKNFEIISLKCPNRFAWNFWTLPRYLRAYPVDIYLTQYITPFFVPRKIKLATIIHDISFNFFPQFIKLSDLFFLKTLIPLSIRRSGKVIGVSKFTQNEIVKYYATNPKKTAFIYNAVSEDFLRQDISPEKMSAVKEKYELPEKFILYVGTLQPRKNLPALVEALALLKTEGEYDLKLVLAGGKGHNYDTRIDEAIAAAKLEKDVIFPGFVDEKDKAALMAAAEVFCFPSLYEGFGIPILEAMSVGTPVIASDISPHKEIAEGAALFFNPEVPGELASRIKSILKEKSLRQNLIRMGRENCSKFTWKDSAEKLLGILTSAE